MWLRYHIFDMFKTGDIRLLISDTSISVGINLPVRTCVQCGDMSASLFRQTGGRAGRRGYDDKGYIIPLLNKGLIRTYFRQNIPPVSLNFPSEMSYTDLICLTTPNNLEAYNHNGEPDTSTHSLQKHSALKHFILNKYVSCSNQDTIKSMYQKMYIIHNQKWNYHRLTNLIRKLTYNESMIIMKMLVAGQLHQITPMEFIHIIGYVFETECIPDGNDRQINKYLDQNIIDRIHKYAEELGISISHKRNHSFLYEFCKNGTKDAGLIDRIGNWLYILKTNVELVAPSTDSFSQLITKVDALFITAYKKII